MAKPSAWVHENKTLRRVLVTTTKGDAAGSHGTAFRALKAGGFNIAMPYAPTTLDIYVRPDDEGLTRTAQLVRGQLEAHGMTVNK